VFNEVWGRPDFGCLNLPECADAEALSAFSPCFLAHYGASRESQAPHDHDDPRHRNAANHILAQQANHPESTGTLSWILSALSISAKVIADQIRRARLVDVLGKMGSDNVQGEEQQKLDVISNEVLIRTLGTREGVAIIASEE